MFAQYENAISALKSVNIPPSYMYLYPTPRHLLFTDPLNRKLN